MAVRRLTAGAKKGISRITWDLRYHYPAPVRNQSNEFSTTSMGSAGTLAMPGTYTVSMDLVAAGEVTRLVDPVAFETVPLELASWPAYDRQALHAFQEKITELSRMFMGMDQKVREDLSRVMSLKQAALRTPGVDLSLQNRITRVEQELKDIQFTMMHGPPAKASWEELPPMEMPLSRRINVAVRTHWSNTAGLNKTVTDQYQILKAQFPPLVEKINALQDEIITIDAELEAAGAGWTPGRKIVL